MLIKLDELNVLNAYSQVHYKDFAFILSPHLLSTKVLTLAINNVAQKEEATMKMLLKLGERNPQSTTCDIWSLRLQDIA
jgi:hypothetical protein